MHQNKLEPSMKSVILFLSTIVYLIFFIAVDQCLSETDGVYLNSDPRVEFGSTPNPVGSGARALGMGGAFIAIADDATAASWNPAGLIQLELPEMSVVGAYRHHIDDFSYKAFPEASGKTDITEFDLNYLSVAYPFNVFNKNMILSLNYQHMFDFNKKLKFSYEKNYDTYSENNISNYDTHGSLYTLSPAFALQITQSFSWGVTLNFWENLFSSNQWKTDHTIKRIILRNGMQNHTLETNSDIFELNGLNFHTGFLWNITNAITIGGVFKSPFKAKIEHTYKSYSESYSDQYSIPEEPYLKNHEILEMPMSYGIGAGLRLSDALSFSFDLFYTQWRDYILKTSSGKKIIPLTGNLEEESDIKDTTQVRLGMEYLKILNKTIIPFRLGIFYDPEPAEGSPDDFFGFSTGTGFMYKKVFFDIAYQYRFGRDVKTITIAERDSTIAEANSNKYVVYTSDMDDLCQDVDQHMVYASMIFHY